MLRDLKYLQWSTSADLLSSLVTCRKINDKNKVMLASPVDETRESTTSSQHDTSNKRCYLCKCRDGPLLKCVNCMRYCDSICAWLDTSQSVRIKATGVFECSECINRPEGAEDMDSDAASVISLDLATDTHELMTRSLSPTTDKPTMAANERQSGNTKSSTVTKRRRQGLENISPPMTDNIYGSDKKSSISSKRRKRSSSPVIAPQSLISNFPSSPPVIDSQVTSSTVPQLVTVDPESDKLESAITTIQTHLDYLRILRTRNAELQQQVTELKKEINAKEEVAWEMKEHNENLQGRVTELEDRNSALDDALQNIRRLCSANILGADL